jgi:DNA-binding transcriptional LysR family regulator
VRLFAPMSLGCRYLGGALAAFRARYPEVIVDLQLGDGPFGSAVEDPDVALCFEAELRDSHVARSLMRTDVGVFAAPALLTRVDEPRHPLELRFADCLTLGSSRGATHWSFTNAASGESHTVAVKSVLNASHVEVLIDAAVHAAGIAMLPVSLVSELPAQGGLRRVLAEWECEAPTLYITYRSRRNQPMAVVKLIEYLTDAMRTPRLRPQAERLRLLAAPTTRHSRPESPAPADRNRHRRTQAGPSSMRGGLQR